MSEGISPAIVVVAYDRPDALFRLLGSLARADFEKCGEVPLVISIDGGGNAAVRAEASRFAWQHGPRRVIEHAENLGLREHVLRCGDLSEEFGAVVILEDDLVVAPSFYRFACEAGSFYETDDRIAGISLYADDYNEYARLRFVPCDDGYDNHFIQTASSRGQLFTKRQWRAFRAWRPSALPAPVPTAVSNWPDTSWKKHYIRFMVETDRHFVYPRTSLSTNFGDVGTHYPRATSLWQVPLALRSHDAPPWRFSQLDDSNAVYDAHYELDARWLSRLAPQLAGLDVVADLYGTRDLSVEGAEWVISPRACSSAERRYAFAMVPAEANVLCDVRGDFFALARRDAFGGLPLRKRALQYRQLHKDAGFKRHAALAFEALRERFRS